MNNRHFVFVCAAASLLGLAVAACAADENDASPANSQDAIQGAPARSASRPADPCTYIKCSAGYRCDPKVGSCVPEAPAPAPAPLSGPALVCPVTKCTSGFHCEEPVGCVPDADDCSTAKCSAGTTNVPGLGCCLATCGGFLGAPCAGGTTCVDDPTDDCDPKRGGSDCMGVCVGAPAK